jgi:hypothetical protein
LGALESLRRKQTHVVTKRLLHCSTIFSVMTSRSFQPSEVFRQYSVRGRVGQKAADVSLVNLEHYGLRATGDRAQIIQHRCAPV